MGINLQPLFNRVIVKRNVEEKTGTIILSKNTRMGSIETNEGEIVAIGEDVSCVSIGEFVLYGRYDGVVIQNSTYGNYRGVTIDDDKKFEYVMMNDDAIMGKVIDYKKEV